MNATRRRRRTRWPEVLRIAGLSLVAFFLFLLPIWVVVVNSAKPLVEAGAVGLGLPQHLAVVENYSQVIERGNVVRSFLNSLFVTTVSVSLTVLVSAMAAWVFARSRSRVIRRLYYICIVGLVLPISLLPTIFLLRTTGLYGDYTGLAVIYVGAMSSFGIFLLTGFVKGIPAELEDAARIDGAGMVRTFTAVVLPLLRPAISALVAILAIVIWNDFFTPFFFLVNGRDNTLTLSVYAVYSSSLHQTNWNLVFASVVLTGLPMLVVFFFAQRSIINAYLSGAVRG